MHLISIPRTQSGPPSREDGTTAVRQATAAPRTSFTPDVRGAAGAVAHWAADRESAGTRRGLQIVLGLIWLADAALQYQPFMFGKAFVTQVIAPAQMGSPGVVTGPALAAGHLIAADVPPWNAAFATIQLALALGLLWRPTVRAALAGTVVWALSVWWLGEGLGGVLTGSATPITGAPGAAVLYAFLAVLIWPARPAAPTGSSVADDSPLGRSWARLGWLLLWGSSAYLAVQAPNRAPGALHDGISQMASGEPGPVAALDRWAAAAAGPHGTIAVIVIAVLSVIIGCGIFVPAATRPVLILAGALALAIWMAGENFGGILTGHGTDPNTGPVLILLALAFSPRSVSRPGGRRPAVPAQTAGGHQLTRSGRQQRKKDSRTR
jgi:uncharacterized membrane protein YphA (DoxX/SURF4 family)